MKHILFLSDIHYKGNGDISEESVISSFWKDLQGTLEGIDFKDRYDSLEDVVKDTYDGNYCTKEESEKTGHDNYKKAKKAKIISENPIHICLVLNNDFTTEEIWPFFISSTLSSISFPFSSFKYNNAYIEDNLPVK